MKLPFLKVFIIFFNFALFSHECWAINQQTSKEDKLPVLTEKGYKIIKNQSKENILSESIIKSNSYSIKDKTLEAVNIIEDISMKEISSLVTKIRGNLCPQNPTGSYEVWLQIAAGTSTVIINASGETGIKAIINCP